MAKLRNESIKATEEVIAKSLAAMPELIGRTAHISSRSPLSSYGGYWWTTRAAKVIEARFLGGLSEPEAAKTLDISVATLKRDWDFARTWLENQLG